MTVQLKLTADLLADVRAHLRVPHLIAFERVGFLACRGAWVEDGTVVVAREFLPVADDHYVEADDAGARISSDAVRLAMQHAYNTRDCMVYVHAHEHRGRPRPSRVDLECWHELIPAFWHVRPELPHGALILSDDSAMALMWVPGRPVPVPVDEFLVVGYPLTRLGGVDARG